MKKILTYILILISCNCFATIKYFSSSTGNDANTGLSPAQAYATVSKAASIIGGATNGDTILFKRGDIFYGYLYPYKNATMAAPITIDAYGTGANPIFSGMTYLSSWTQSSGNIYYTSLNVPRLNLVMMDSVVQGMGRYPNTGVLNYQSHLADSSITSSALTGTPNFTGAEVVIRKVRWILDRHIITGQAGSKLSFGATNYYGNNSAYSPVDGNGFFIQNSLATLDQDGEWYYDPTAKLLYMYFASGSPTGHSVKAAGIDYNLTLSSSSYLNFSNIDFEGSNLSSINLNAAISQSFTNCNIRNQGGNGIYANGAVNVKLNGCSISNCLNTGFFVEQNGDTCQVNNTTVTDIGRIAGMGKSGDGAQMGVYVVGNNTTMAGNTVRRIGYSGINFNGNNALIQNNYVDSFCMVKDDGGGIYTFGNTTNSNRVVKKNVVLNAVGAVVGTEAYSGYENFGKACAFYFDGNTNHVLLDSNMFANGGWDGVFINNNTYNQITNNTVYNFAQAIAFNESSPGNINNNTITNNKFIAKTANQLCMQFNLYAADNVSLFGSFNNNIYARPVNDSITIQIARFYSGGTTSNYTLATWQSGFTQDAASTKSPISISDINTFRVDYNTTNAAVTKTLTGGYKDVSNNVYSSSYSLPAYSGQVLMPFTIVAGTPKIILIGGKIILNAAGKILMTN